VRGVEARGTERQQEKEFKKKRSSRDERPLILTPK
jgi:hypothetical protein